MFFIPHHIRLVVSQDIPRPVIFLACPKGVLEWAKDEGHLSEEGYAASHNDGHLSGEPACEDFYKNRQSLQNLGEEYQTVQVPIWIDTSSLRQVACDWQVHLDKAIADINEAAPGLNLYRQSKERLAKVKIYSTPKETCYTRGNICRPRGTAEIHLYPHWLNKKRTSCHELLHALGFGHEHQRQDAEEYLGTDVNPTDKSATQYLPKPDMMPLVRFDPFSIMLYPEGEKLYRRDGDKVWNLKPKGTTNDVMSELDKVGVNTVYRPCKRNGYNPQKSSVNGMYYCGR